MPDTFWERLRRGYNAFNNKDTTRILGSSYGSRPDRPRLTLGAEKTISAAIYTRFAIDAASYPIHHVRLDQNGRYLKTISSGLNDCLSLEANVDQTGRGLIQDIIMSMFDEGCVAIVPVDTTEDLSTDSFDILSIRTGKVLQWYPYHVRLDVYNEQTGLFEQIVLPKKSVAIVENPLYSVMNEPNSTLKRLVRTLSLLDVVGEQSASGKLDIFIQLPYTVRTQARREQAEIRRAELEKQLSGSKYGIAYVDATEKVTQLNRPAENNLLAQAEFLTDMLFGQLGLAESIYDGTADEKVMTNYYNRTLEPVLSAITDSMKCKYLTKTGRSQGQSIMHSKDPFKFVPVSQLGAIVDSFSRNTILSANEVRSVLGYSPSNEPNADKLTNKNVTQPQADSRLSPASEEKPLDKNKGATSNEPKT